MRADLLVHKGLDKFVVLCILHIIHSVVMLSQAHGRVARAGLVGKSCLDRSLQNTLERGCTLRIGVHFVGNVATKHERVLKLKLK